MSILEFERVTYRYPASAAPALLEVTVSFAPGELCVLAGPSGGGKSTLLRAASGLVPHFHGGEFAGRVRVAGLDTREHRPAELAMVAGTVLQDPETQVVMGTVRAELALALESRGDDAAAVARGVEEAALALGIAHLLDRRTATLSGGELQRVALAAALAPRPPLLLLDEPTAQLDPVAGDDLIWQLRRLNQEWETAVILVEHRLERCLAAADRVVVLDGGAISCDAPPSEFLEWAGEHAPALQTPGARLFAAAGLRPLPAGVRQARATLRAQGLLPAHVQANPRAPAPARSPRMRMVAAARRRGAGVREARTPALHLRGVWHELRDGPAILRGVELRLNAGETLALMGRNGAGKSTLLRHAAGLMDPTRGSVSAAGRVALLMQNPNDYLLHDHVADEAPAGALAAVGLADLGARHPRDLSGGQRQRLALAIVLGASLGGGEPAAAVIALDEPTRGMDRASKLELAQWLRARAGEGSAVVVATHDAELAAELAGRVVLMADGVIIADGPAGELLAGGFYFATETARILGGGAVLAQDGARLLRDARPAPARAAQ